MIDELSETGNASDSFWGGVATETLGAAAVQLKQSLLDESANTSNQVLRNHVLHLARKIDERVSKGELVRMWREIDSRLTSYESQLSEQKYRIHILNRDSKRNASKINEHEALIRLAQEKHRKIEQDFLRSTADLNLQLEGIRQGIAVFKAEFANEKQRTRTAQGKMQARVSQLERAINPKTAGETATALGADGARMLIHNEDADEARKLLLLSIAYDKRTNQHGDPGARYFLALAYRRLGDDTRAEEWLMEAVFAERFRRTPDWFQRATEWFQGDDRIWLRSTRRDPRFGAAAPRRVNMLLPIWVAPPTRPTQLAPTGS